MSTIQLELEEEVTLALESSEQTASTTLRGLAVMEAFRRQVISSGRAAELLGVSRHEFLIHCGSCGIPVFNMTDVEWEDEFERIEAMK